MPAGLTRAEVEAIASLAHLELSESELELFARQLGQVLAYAKQVQQLDTTGVPPTASVVTRRVGNEAGRPDVVRPCLTQSEALANAPDAALDAGLFRVPRVIG